MLERIPGPLKNESLWTALAVGVAFLALLVTGVDACSTRQATREELGLIREQLRGNAEERELFRQQVAASFRPILVPELDERSERLARDSGVLHFVLRNVTYGITLFATVAAGAPGGNPDPEGRVRYPSCTGYGEVDPEHLTWDQLEPFEPRESQDVDLELFVGPDEVICVTVAYTDAGGRQWVTDWAWNGVVGERAFEQLYLQSYRIRELEWWAGDIPELLDVPPARP